MAELKSVNTGGTVKPESSSTSGANASGMDAKATGEARESAPPPAPKSQSFEEAKAERLRQIRADEPAEAGTEPVEDERNYSRTLILPITNGEIDSLGVDIKGFSTIDVINNYRDVVKVRVTGPSSAVAELRKRSQQYLNENWS